ncbi:hypothetical protein VCRA2128O102_400018 [Vibrio crassostreae]|nr:hypothetical protein VCRA2128O106_410018 [Vibrio crassostreae]CAK2953100.1 hypothetical protein VCRA2128O100_430018 [Vibrio crassostreae]CAK3437145.1 hypothetical protein VCRA2128O102_400018 [Vibrio crassostreae]CAK3547849.1 hypothetical protein VCRA2126O88_420032 [Vibrio crassostreae]CAK3608819.1 hypothetical protein VCRA2128O108_420018 [Vibrio crassostreae]
MKTRLFVVTLLKLSKFFAIPLKAGLTILKAVVFNTREKLHLTEYLYD